uniref:Cyclin C-terminal domain-containing protein n=1 Tax=Oncorhynchus tshawytscha TaxID=74940 RepID=A0A8C8FAH2_ONCTS
ATMHLGDPSFTMFHNSSQRKFWTFDNEESMKLRYEPNREILQQNAHQWEGKIICSILGLVTHEEDILFRHYEKRLLDFCNAFKPVIPKSVVGTAIMYFRRFYLNNSLMEYHPRTIMLTCAYLTQFVGDLQILEYVLLLIQQLNFHLVVHTIYRLMEGLLIYLKTRHPLLENLESLRKSADDFMTRATLTDTGLLFLPSEIAMTAILNSASQAGLSMESYLTACMGLKEDKETLLKMYDAMIPIPTTRWKA